MKAILKFTFLLAIILFIVDGCKRDELDIDKMAKTIEVERDIAIPLVYGNLRLKSLVGENSDSIITIETDTVFHDTLSLNIPDDIGKDITVEFLNLPYKSTNYIPAGANIMLIEYDSISNTNLDTIKFSQNGVFFLPPPLDSQGNVIESEVIEKSDMISVSTSAAENLFKYATHLILDAELIVDSTRIIPINDKTRFWLDMGFEAKIKVKQVIK